jgi:Tfp pilus assembly protein PilE
MMLLTVTLLTILFSTMLVLGCLREIASDTYNTIAAGPLRAQAEGVLVQRAAFAGLWMMIFVLCYI